MTFKLSMRAYFMYAPFLEATPSTIATSSTKATTSAEAASSTEATSSTSFSSSTLTSTLASSSIAEHIVAIADMDHGVRSDGIHFAVGPSVGIHGA